MEELLVMHTFLKLPPCLARGHPARLLFPCVSQLDKSTRLWSIRVNPHSQVLCVGILGVGRGCLSGILLLSCRDVPGLMLTLGLPGWEPSQLWPLCGPAALLAYRTFQLPVALVLRYRFDLDTKAPSLAMGLVASPESP